ncbi:exported hypothetical protein [Rhodospirillaceae bacterium LM-1]|nr:exported hypothetical protein [Rhodospirillaceae bacterium LM-1]
MKLKITYTPRLLAAALAVVGVTTFWPTAPALACGESAYIGELCVFAFNYCPQDFLPADGRSLPIQSNEALFSLLGITYGGDGKTEFKLPDLRKSDKDSKDAMKSAGTTCIAVMGLYPVRP